MYTTIVQILQKQSLKAQVGTSLWPTKIKYIYIMIHTVQEHIVTPCAAQTIKRRIQRVVNIHMYRNLESSQW